MGKKYSNHDNYIIQIDFTKKTILYDTGNKDNSIIVSNRGTANFSKYENFVVLECVNRLLEKGYKPNSIELEHSWASGHKETGRLDILVKKNGNSYVMIECKTYEDKFNEEKKNMLLTKKVGNEEQPKGQLFTYGYQEKTTEYLCLYASILDNGVVKYQNAIVPIEEEWRNLSNQKEMFDHWNKHFKYNGIFEDYVYPYNINCKALLRGDLDNITDEDSSRIFNQFLEILRHNAISDKPNAFNKILNLFICKIIDEDRNYDEEVKFQWKDNSTYISMLSDLEDLYKEGMDKFLDITVTDYSDMYIDSKLAILDNEVKIELKKMFQELRLQKNAEFAFKEVYNEESFNDNAKVVKSVVQLLQGYQFRYGHKQQFLGNFFELLLNTSIKQEVGQYFTPVPIAKFMISCIPIRDIIDNKIKLNNKTILPLAIDFASGSGHFLTEYMDIVQGIINKYDTTKLKKSIKNTIEKWKQTEDEQGLQGEFEWAKDCVYGIEKDYRLVKTSKISTFLNGDGDANIIHADGLDKFTSNKYKGALSSETINNNKFDIVIANPPYSVSSFKPTLSCDEHDFETYNLLTDNSSEIECLFVERTKQLLRDGGYAAIILPTSICTNDSNIEEKTREILLKHFYIKAIMKMGPNTFMATGTNTSIFFLQKRPDTDYITIEKLVEKFFKDYKDFSYNNTTEVISKYVTESFENLTIDEYIMLIRNNHSQELKEMKFYKELETEFKEDKDYKTLISKKNLSDEDIESHDKYINELFIKFIHKIERVKILFYLLTFKNKTLIIHVDDGKTAEKKFLGYEFSNRKKNEGIHYYIKDDGSIDSALYDDIDLYSNTSKVNYYINKVFKNEKIDIPENLSKNLKYINSNDLFTFDDVKFTNKILLNKREKVKYDCNSMKLSQCVDLKIGGTPPRRIKKYFTGENLWVSIAEMNGQIITSTKEMITDEAIQNSNVKLVKRGTTLLSFKLSIGKVAMAGKDLYTNEAIAALEIKDEYKDSILDEYLFYLFKSKTVDIQGDTKSFGNSLNTKTLGQIIIPVPLIEEQKTFINKYKEILKDGKDSESRNNIFDFNDIFDTEAMEESSNI